MPVYNVTIDDSSPLIQYDQWWTDSSHADSLWASYTNGTFHATSQYGATAMLAFNGSAVYIFGAKRPNHDVYSVTLDGSTTAANGNSGSINIFNATLFNQTGLDTSKPHQVALRNEYSTSTPAYVDVDCIIVTAGDGNEATQSQDTVWDDDYATYTVGWDTSPNGLESNYYNETMHRTSVVGASASVIFTGNAISVYGTTSTNHGFFSVSLDSATPIVLNGTIEGDQPSPRYQNLLYWAGGLSSGQHNVTIANVDDNGNWLDLDKFVVSTWPQSNASGTATAGSSPTASGTSKSAGDNGGGNSTHHSSAGAIIGGIVAAVVAVALIGLGIFLFYRRYSRRGLDRIQRVRPANGSKDADMFSDTEEPFTVVEPFTAGSSMHERTPLSPSTLAAGPHGTTSFSASTTQLYASSSTVGMGKSEDEESKYILPNSLTAIENPHRDLPPPDYEQATAANSSRRVRPLPPIQTDQPNRKS